MGFSVFLFSISDDDDRGTGEKEVKGQANARSPPNETKRGTKDCQKQKLAVGSVPVRLKVRYSTTVAALLHR